MMFTAADVIEFNWHNNKEIYVYINASTVICRLAEVMVKSA